MHWLDEHYLDWESELWRPLLAERPPFVATEEEFEAFSADFEEFDAFNDEGGDDEGFGDEFDEGFGEFEVDGSASASEDATRSQAFLDDSAASGGTARAAFSAEAGAADGPSAQNDFAPFSDAGDFLEGDGGGFAEF